MAKVGDYYLFNKRTRMFFNVYDSWGRINKMRCGYPKKSAEELMPNRRSDPDFIFVKIGENGEIIFLR